MASLSALQSKYVTTTVTNGVIAFVVGAIANAALVWAILGLLGLLLRPWLFGAVVLVTLLPGITLFIAAGLAAIVVWLVLKRLGRQLTRRHQRQFVLVSAVLSMIFGYAVTYLGYLSYHHAWAMALEVYIEILFLGLPFTLAWLWATRRETVRH